MKKFVLCVFIAGLIITMTACGKNIETVEESSENEKITASQEIEYESARITNGKDLKMAEFIQDVDGDSAYLYVTGVEEFLNFAGIVCPDADTDTTEAKPWGPEAAAYTTNALSNARKIYVEYSEEDLYGNTQAWIWYDGHLLQEELLENGLADCTNYAGLSEYADTLYGARDKAKAEEIGIWGPW